DGYGTSGTVVEMDWSNPSPQDRGVTVYGTWTFVVAPNVNDVQAPWLPASFSDWAPYYGWQTPSYEVPSILQVSTVSSPSGMAIPDYAEFRRIAPSFPPAKYDTAPYVPALPHDGVVMVRTNARH